MKTSLEYSLVTGAAGFIGTNLSKRLLEKGKRVLGVDNFITGSKKNVKFLSSFANFSFIEMDITNPFILKELEKVSIREIYELACPTGVENLKIMAIEMLLASTIGTKHMLEVAQKNRCPLLYASSSEIYGDPEMVPQKEEYNGSVNTLSPRACYEEGKRCGESLVMAYHREAGVNAKIVRIFNTYGPFFSEKDQRVVPRLFSQALNDRDLVIFGDGKQIRSFLYIDDLLNAFFLIMEKSAAGEAYNVGSTKEIYIEALAEKILKFSGSKGKIVHKGRDPLDLKNRRLPSVEKIEKMGWRETINIEDGLKKLAYL